MYQKVKSFFLRTEKPTRHVELLRLESLPGRQVQQIEEYIHKHFRTLNHKEIEEELQASMVKLQAESTLRGIISYLLLLKDLVCIGPERTSEVLLNYKLKFENNLILGKFYSYVVKLAYTHDIYMETLQIYNGDRSVFGGITTIKAYKVLNYLMEIFSAIQDIDSAQAQYLSNFRQDSLDKPSSPAVIYNRIRMCLIADIILYFNYTKQAILTAPLRTNQTSQEQISLAQQFSETAIQFRRVLHDSKVQNSYYSKMDERSVLQAKRQIQRGMVSERPLGLSARDPNRTCVVQSNSKAGCQFSFGHFTSRQV